MHCCCCDKILNDFESCRKSKSTGDYLDMCNTCYSTVQEEVPSRGRAELDYDEIPDEDLDVEPWEEYDED